MQYNNGFKMVRNYNFINSLSKVLSLSFVTAVALFLNACSTGYGSTNPQSRALPTIPEISRPVVSKPSPRVTSTKKQVKNEYTPKVKKYSVDKPAEPIITQTEVAAVLSKEERVKIAQRAATVEFDPYAVVPDGNSPKVVTSKTIATGKASFITAKASPAVASLMLQAKGELAIGNTQSAVSKLERGLRIESQNPELWNLLAQANYDQSSYQQAISMAKKSIRYSRNNDFISKNWKLIQKAGERSGDTVVVKEALNYFKVNP